MVHLEVFGDKPRRLRSLGDNSGVLNVQFTEGISATKFLIEQATRSPSECSNRARYARLRSPPVQTKGFQSYDGIFPFLPESCLSFRPSNVEKELVLSCVIRWHLSGNFVELMHVSQALSMQASVGGLFEDLLGGEVVESMMSEAHVSLFTSLSGFAALRVSPPLSLCLCLCLCSSLCLP